MSVLDHILQCDVERTRLLKEMNKLVKADDGDMDDDEKSEKT